MKNVLWVVILCAFTFGAPSFAQVPSDKLETVSRQLLSKSNTSHTEYRRCLTTKGYNCAHWNNDYVQIEAHGPSIADTLAWIGDQLTARKLVHLYKFEGCKIAVDLTDGTPASLLWLARKDGKLVKSNRSIITPARDKAYKADWFGGNGHYSYLKKNHRENGSAQSPKRLTYFNDAALIDLAKIESTKSRVITDEKGDLVLRDKPISGYRFSFFRGDANQVIGTQFDNEASIFSAGPSPFPNIGKTLKIFDDQYSPIKTVKKYSHFNILLTMDDVEFALNIAKAFRHTIELCELETNQTGK